MGELSINNFKDALMVRFSGESLQWGYRKHFNFPKKPEQASAGLPTLNRYINSNRVTTMEPGFFDNLASTLLVLKLNRNRISAIPPKMFKLPQLQHL